MKQSLDYILGTRDATVGHWKFRDSLFDESVHDNTLSLIGSSGFVEGYTENGLTALVTDGSENMGCQIFAAEASDFDMDTDNFSIEIVFKPIVTTSPILVEKFLGLTGWIAGLYNQKIAFVIGNGTQTKTKFSATLIPTGLQKWYYMTITVERGHEIRIFINGIEDADSPFSETLSGNISNPSANLYIGKPFNGVIDEICISRELLTPATIIDRAQGRFNPAPTVDPEFLRRFLPAIHQSNADLLNFLTPATRQYLDLKDEADDLLRLVRFDECPDRYLSHLASLFDFELIDPDYGTLQERRSFFPWITWIYKRKGRADAAQKIMDLLGYSYEWTEIYPDWVPFLSNFHRLYDRELVAVSSFEDAFTSGNLSKWNPPLRPGAYWRISGGKLRGSADSTYFDKNAITFDDVTTDYYMETTFQIVDGFGAGAQFGMYLRWQDANNWLRIEITTDSILNDLIFLTRRVNGVEWSTVIAEITDSIQQEIGLHTLWVYANHDTDKYTIGIDDRMFSYKFAWPVTGVASTQKGLWVNKNLTVDFTLVRVQTINTRLIARTITEDFQKHIVKIKLNNHPQFDSNKRMYLQQVLPKYVPFFVTLDWVYEPETQARLKLKMGSFVTKLGYRMCGDRAARLRLKAGGFTAILGSLTKTMESAAIKLSTHLTILKYSVMPAYLRLRTGTLITELILVREHGWLRRSVDTDGQRPLFQEDAFIDNDKDTGVEDMAQSSIGVSLISAGSVSVIKIYDEHSEHPDGLYQPITFRIFGSNTNQDGSWTLHQTFDNISRIGRTITLTLTTPIVKKYIKINDLTDDAPTCPYGHRLYFSEIEIE